MKIAIRVLANLLRMGFPHFHGIWLSVKTFLLGDIFSRLHGIFLVFNTGFLLDQITYFDYSLRASIFCFAANFAAKDDIVVSVSRSL